MTFKLNTQTMLSLIVALILSIALLNTAHAKDRKGARGHGPSLSVTGTGKITAEPDIAFLSAGVLSEADTPEGALNDNNKKMQAIFALLADTGIERKHIQTSNFSIQPRYNHHRPKPGETRKPPEIVGYTVNNTITVKVVDLEKLGPTITNVVQSGSNQLGSIYFDISNKEALFDKARKEAVEDAKRKAEIYTSAAGVKLGKLVAIREGTRHSPRPRHRDFASEALVSKAAAPTPIAAGEQKLSLSVTIRWKIEQ